MKEGQNMAFRAMDLQIIEKLRTFAQLSTSTKHWLYTYDAMYLVDH